MLYPLEAKDSSPKQMNVTQLEANDVDYDGKKIRLAGSVRIDHPFGELCCEKAVLLLAEGSETSKKMIPERILLEGQVHVLLQDGSSLVSDEADLDCKTLEAVFTATLPTKVIYTTSKDGGVNGIPIRASSRALRVKMKKDVASNSSEYALSDVQGEDAVTIEYLNALSEEASK
jgi:hypothetical protein